ncbi:hypothetical protein [Acidithiobacillus ferriphilus]|nr:hypothetical protein [Acidithiobacillus ferriphilus]MEB8476692.1 hypothetical protein [Acidithiobacillus ferriphilus]
MNPYHNTPDAELLRIVAGDDVLKHYSIAHSSRYAAFANLPCEPA